MYSDDSTACVKVTKTLCRLTNQRARYIKNNLLLQIPMNAAERSRPVETWQYVKILWDHSSAFVRKVLVSMTKKANVMVSMIQVHTKRWR